MIGATKEQSSTSDMTRVKIERAKWAGVYQSKCCQSIFRSHLSIGSGCQVHLTMWMAAANCGKTERILQLLERATQHDLQSGVLLANGSSVSRPCLKRRCWKGSLSANIAGGGGGLICRYLLESLGAKLN